MSCTLREAHARARRRSRRIDDEVYVVREGGAYFTADEHDLETFFAGVRDDNILAVYLDGEPLD